MKTGMLLLVLAVAISIPLWELSDERPDKGIAKMREAAIAAYNDKDIDRLMALWHTDGRIIGRAGPTPDIVNGHDQIRALYLSQFESPHFVKVSMQSEDSELIDGIFIDSGTQSLLNESGEVILAGCYVMLFKMEDGKFKTWREYSYPFCMNVAHD